jgi:ABC-type transport system substrate-binding protein
MSQSNELPKSLSRRSLLAQTAGGLTLGGLMTVPGYRSALASAEVARHRRPYLLQEEGDNADTLYLWSPASWPVPEATRFYGWEDEMIRELAYEALLAFDVDLNIVPGIAERWDVSDDGTEYTFFLRPDVLWQDGERLTAEDVKFSVELFYNPQLVPPPTHVDPAQTLIVGFQEYADGTADHIAGIEVVDDTTITFTLTEPHAGFLMSLTPGFWIRMLPEHIWGQVPPDQVNQDPRWTTPIATGPFKIVKFEPEQYIEYARFDDYWGGQPAIARCIMRISNIDVALAQLERGELDYVVNAPPTELARLRELEDIEVVSVPNQTWGWGLWFNYKHPIWRDVRARQALMYGVDRQGYVDSILGGEGTVLNHTLLMPGWAQAPDAATYNYDPEKAKQLLTEAGFDFNRTIHLWYYPGVDERSNYAPIFQASMQALGVKVELTNIETAQLTERIYDDDGLAWDLMISSTIPAFDPSATESSYSTNGEANVAFLMFTFDPTGFQRAGYSSVEEFVDNWLFSIPEVDELYIQGRTETDPDQRALIYQQIDKLLTEAVPVAFFAEKNYVDAYNRRIQGVVMNANTNRRYFDIAHWSLSG